MAARKYSFPLLKPREIFSCLQEMNVRVSEEEIRACDAGAVRRVLEAFIESTMGVTREEMAQVAFPGLPTLSFPEIHAQSVPEITFYRTAQRLLKACGVEDFGLQDVLHPTPKRVRRQLSALINFSKFREERLAAFNDIIEQTDELLAKKKALQEENAALQRQLDQLEEEQRAERPARLQLQAEVGELQKEIDFYNRKQAVLRHEKDKKRDERKKVEDTVASLKFDKVEAEKEIERLKAQIITSPDRVKNELTSIAETLEKAKEDVRELEEKRSAVLDFIDVYERAERELSRTFTLLDEIEQEMKACKKVKHQIKTARKRIRELKLRIAETITRRQRQEKLVELKKRDLYKYIEEARVAEETASKALQTARGELNKLESVRSEVRQRIIQNTETSRKVEMKMREDEAHYQKELKNLEQMYSRLQQSAEYYNSQVLNAIGSSSSSQADSTLP